MASNEQSVTLLRRNKAAQVEALNSLGFDLPESARAADFPMYVKWGSGLLDVNIAANRKSDNAKFFFTKDEWQSLTETEKSNLLMRGIRVRAHGASFVMGLTLLSARKWGPSIRVEDSHSSEKNRDVYKWWDAYNETVLVRNFLQGKSDSNCTGAPAAEAALAYKAFTQASDGLEDDSQWCLPTAAHAHLMFRYKNEINSLIIAVLGSDYCIGSEKIWTCLQYPDATNVCRMDFASGSLYTENRATVNCPIRVICLE